MNHKVTTTRYFLYLNSCFRFQILPVPVLLQARDLLQVERKLNKQELHEIQCKRSEAAVQREKNLSKADRQRRDRLINRS